jgi:DNA-binding response OmpR family regulator
MAEGKQKILLAGDRVAERDALGLAMGDRGFYPRVASSDELLLVVAEERPDLVVLDAECLRNDGVAAAVRHGRLRCPLVVILDESTTELRTLAMESGASLCLDGKASFETLAASVERFLQVGETRRESARVRLDFVGLARRSTRDQFVAAWPCPFIVSGASLVSTAEQKSTADILDADVLQAIQNAVADREGITERPRRFDTPRRSSATALAVRRAVDVASDDIRVGRALDVDVFIDHATISKHHASFLRGPTGIRLADLGSRNGTWVSGRLLVPKGPPSPILESGESLRFGELGFTFLNPAAAWDVLRVNVR